MRKGFTLVELSIVLVIIGLLIGGILVGQSLIESAKLRSFVDQLSQYDIAVNLFEDKFRSIPGDSAIISPQGDGDGWVFDATDNTRYFTGELPNFWYHLSSTGMLKEQYSNSGASSGIVAGTHVPLSKWGEDAAIIAGKPNHPTSSQFYSNPAANVYWITHSNDTSSNFNGSGSCASCGYTLSTIEALSVDKKIDDSNALEGIVRYGGKYGFYASGDWTNCINSGNGNWRVENSGNLCNLFVQMHFTQLQ